jgi:peroxiredoxin
MRFGYGPLPSGPLASDLKWEADRFAADADKNDVKAVEDLVGDLEHSDIIARALKVGERAPDFELATGGGKLVSLAGLLTEGAAILTWYRGGWCPYCNLQLSHLQTYLELFRAEGATLAALSPELPVKSIATGERHQLGFDLLVDRHNRVAKKFGGVHRMNDGTRGYYGRMGVMDYYEEHDLSELPIPATYIIDRTGVVQYAYVNADFRKRPEPEEILGVVRGVV